jgi:hypothetical protein
MRWRRKCSYHDCALAASAAGVATTTPHVTIGYFQRIAAPEAILRQLILLDKPAIPIQATGLFSWSKGAHPQFGYTLSLHVDRSDALQRWRRARISPGRRRRRTCM